MTSESMAPSDVSATDEKWVRKLALVAALMGLADWLFFRHAIGISVVVFVIALEAGVLIASPARPDWREMMAAVAILVAALLPLIEAPTVIAFLFCVAGAAYFAVVASARATGPWREKAAAALWLLLAGPFWLIPDVGRAVQSANRTGAATGMANAAKTWIMPLVLGAVFLSLFAAANPVLENWLAQLSFRHSVSRIDIVRVAFWAIVLVASWPFICMSRRRITQANELVPGLEQPSTPLPDNLFGDAAIVRALVLFNVLFAVQTVMDIHYLWRGAALPHGMTYAAYAHRGAYPLIVTALLAAAFVIAAMRPGSAAERSPMMRTLAFLWTGQNVLLVVSSILRLNLYVEAYSLTYLRAAAFIWMLLVAIGLVLIVTRIMLYRSNAWLISANLIALALAVYVCAFVNFPYIIASYNVAHSRDMAGKGQPLDGAYLISLGPQAIPAIDRYIAARPGTVAWPLLVLQRDVLATSHHAAASNWRAWSFRTWRLDRYLKSTARGATPHSSGVPRAGGMHG
jgi:hypothetical protein